MNKAYWNKRKYFEQHPDEDQSTQWVVDLICRDKLPARETGTRELPISRKWKGKEYWKYDDVKADENIVICPKCNSCWEEVKSPGERDYAIYKGFPRIGKKIGNICPECK